MPLNLKRPISMRRATEAGPPAPDAVVPARHPRVGLWVLSTFATIAALVAISALVIGPQHADVMLLLPLALFWSVVVSVGFAVRSALMNVARSLAGPRKEKPDATLVRLARMVRTERNREALYPEPHGLVHAA